MVTILVLFVLSTLLSYFISSLLIRKGKKICSIDIPNERSSHSVPIPRGGGIGIVAGIIIPLIALFLTKGYMPEKRNIFILLGMAAIAFAGYCSDRYKITVRTRLFVQMAISMIIVNTLGFIGLSLFSNVPVILVLLTALWITSLINIYNFMDGINGLAGMQGVVLGFSTVLFGIIFSNRDLILAGVLLLGALSGFLVLNITPAKIFMGDTGSYAIGFFAAIIPIIDNRLFVPVIIIMGVFIADTSFTLARRILRGERWYEAHRSHFYQRAVGLGYTHMQVTGSISVVSAVFTVLAVLYLYVSNAGKLVIMFFWLILLACLASWIRKKEKLNW